MKRSAERQISKDDVPDDDDIEEIQEPQGFQKADDASLAKRQIRALPKRSLTASRPPSLNGLSPVPTPDADKVEAIPLPRFGGFVGFGTGTTTSNSFTFTAPPTSAPLFSVSDSASNPAKSSPTFTALPPTRANDFAPTPSPQPSMAESPHVEETDTVAFRYFKSLRGLNVSFLSAISTAVEKDPFFDIGSLVESYKNLRTTIESEFDGSPKPTNSTFPSATNVLPEKNTPSMPKPTTGSTEMSFRLPPTSENGPRTSGFTFPPFVPPTSSASSQLPFNLTTKPSESAASASSFTTPSESAKSAFAFLASSAPASTSSPPPASTSTFTAISKSLAGSSEQGVGSSVGPSPQLASTTPSFGSSSVPSLFATVKPATVFGNPDVAKPTSVFGSSIFGTTETSKPLLNPSPSDSKDTTALFSNVPSSLTSGSIFGTPLDKPAGFFGSASQPKNGGFTFGKPGGSIGNPVGFGFGGSLPSAGDTTTPGSSISGFNFGAPSTKPSESLFSPPMTDKSLESTPQPEAEGNEEGVDADVDAAKLLPTRTHDEEGEGEEDEETAHVVRCKVYRLFKSEDKSEWKDLGVGMFRLKRHKETDIRRALMRNSNTGRILLNFRIYGSLKVSLAKTVISFLGYDNSTPTSFRVRVKTEEQAAELKQAFEREIAAVQTSE